MNTYEMLSISITSPAWEAAVDFSSSVESAVASQNRLVKEALYVWEHRQNSETEQVTFQLIVFTRTGGSVTAHIEKFTVKRVGCCLKVSLATA